MIQPVNDHLLVEPLQQESFISSDKDRLQAVGTVVGISVGQDQNLIGARVYFDDWLISAFPKVDSPNERIWLVKWADVRAIEHVGNGD